MVLLDLKEQRDPREHMDVKETVVLREMLDQLEPLGSMV